MTHEENECARKLTDLIQKVDNIVKLFGNQRRLTGSLKLRAQEMLKDLKTELKAIRLTCETQKYQSQLTEIDQAFLCPAVHEGKTRINVKYNSIPDSKWLEELYLAKSDFKFYLDNLPRK